MPKIFTKFCFYNSERIFWPRDLKFGGNVYFYMRNKKGKVDHWSKIAFYPLKLPFSISGFLRSSDKKGRKKA